MTVFKFKKAIIGYFLALIFLASSWSILSPKFFRVHDFTHAARIAEMTTALKDGHFPVRWVSNLGYGYGMPLFEFYGPLPFYVGSFFYGLGIPAVTSIKILYLIVNAGTILGAYLLGKKLFGKAGGVLTAAALTMAPYRAVNLFIRGALNETWAVMFIPFILLGLIKVFHQEKRGWLVLSLSLTGLFLSHNITTMLFFPVFILFSMAYLFWMFWQKAPEFFRRKRFRWLNSLRIFGSLVGSGLLAIGLSSFYLFPAFLEKELTQFANFSLTSYFNYNLHFLYIRQFLNPIWKYGGSFWGPDDGLSFFLGWGQWLALIVLGWLTIKEIVFWIKNRKWRLGPKQVIIGNTVGLLLVGTLFMTLVKSKMVWDFIPLLEFTQFPWRWLGLSIVLLSIFIGAITWLIPKKSKRTFLALFLSAVIMLGSITSFRPEFYLDNNDEVYYTDGERIRSSLSFILQDYISKEMNSNPTVIAHQLILNNEVFDGNDPEILVDRVHEKLIKTDFEHETRLSLAVASYPGWRAEIDEQWWRQEKGAEGNIELVIPTGEHLVSLRFEGTPIRNYSDWASAISWLLLIYLVLPKNFNQKARRIKND